MVKLKAHEGVGCDVTLESGDAPREDGLVLMDRIWEGRGVKVTQRRNAGQWGRVKRKVKIKALRISAIYCKAAQ